MKTADRKALRENVKTGMLMVLMLILFVIFVAILLWWFATFALPVITNGSNAVNTLGWGGAYNYYANQYDVWRKSLTLADQIWMVGFLVSAFVGWQLSSLAAQTERQTETLTKAVKLLSDTVAEVKSTLDKVEGELDSLQSDISSIEGDVRSIRRA